MKGIRLTNQRVAILNYLKDRKNHPTVEQVYRAVKKKLPRISKATVYQNLIFLADKGMITQVNIKGVARYEPNLHLHHHLICTRCGKIIDFDSAKLTHYSMKIAENIEEMDVESAATNFFGLCSTCRNTPSK
jgi:Fur family ferric uptake transcriptional regulator